MRIDKTIHKMLIWVYEYTIDLLLIIPITLGVIKVIPYITSLYSFTTVYITLCIIRFITIEYKRYSREGIDRSTGISYTDKLTDDLVMITVSKIILLLKYIVAFGILFIIKEFLG